MMNVASIRGWLLCVPKPKVLRLQTDDGDVHEVECRAPGASWMRIAESINALAPQLVEAFDENGKLIRAIRPHDEPDENAEQKEQEGAVRRISTLLPPTTDPETLRMIHFADLLSNAYQHANDSHDVAFNKLVELVDSLNSRWGSMERAIDSTFKLLRHHMEEKIAEAEDAKAEAEEKANDPITEIASAFIAGAQNGAHEGSNGKG